MSGKNTQCLRPTCLAGNLIPRTSSFKYLGSAKQATGGCKVDVDNVIISAWKYSGGMCEKKVTVRLNNKLYKTAIRPIVIYIWQQVLGITKNRTPKDEHHRYEDFKMDSAQNQE